MKSYELKKCTLADIKEVKEISEKTFFETFAEENTAEDMENYLKENFADEKIKSEISNTGSIFYTVKYNDTAAAYMKVNFDKAQTEEGYDNSLEVQRIYVLEEFKGMGIGKTLIDEAKKIAKANNLDYIWLGVWEHNYSAIKFYEKQGFEKFDTHIFVLGDDKQTDNLMKFIL